MNLSLPTFIILTISLQCTTLLRAQYVSDKLPNDISLIHTKYPFQSGIERLDFNTIGLQINNRFDPFRENELRRNFNKVLSAMRKAKVVENGILDDRIFVCQTSETIKDDRIVSILKASDTTNSNVFYNSNSSIIKTTIYDGLYQREIVSLNRIDSIQTSNWYIRRFDSNVVRDLTTRKLELKEEVDSLNSSLIKLHSSREDWRVTQPQVNQIMDKINPYLATIDSIDFLLYNSIVLELYPAYVDLFDLELGLSPFDPFNYYPNYGYVGGLFSNSLEDSLLTKNFKLHHMLIDDPYKGRSITYGDSSVYKGRDISERHNSEEMFSAWRDVRCSYAKISGKYLIVTRVESNIGETFWDYKSTYYLYELLV